MDRYAILDLIDMLACSQGLYGRLRAAINDLPEDEREELFEEWEGMNFADDLEFILFIEC